LGYQLQATKRGLNEFYSYAVFTSNPVSGVVLGFHHIEFRITKASTIQAKSNSNEWMFNNDSYFGSIYSISRYM